MVDKQKERTSQVDSGREENTWSKTYSLIMGKTDDEKWIMPQNGNPFHGGHPYGSR